MLPTGSVSLSIFNLSGTYIDCDGTHTGTSWYCEQYSAAAGTVIATQDVGHDGVLLGVGDVVEAHAEGSTEGHGQAVRNVAFHGQGRADGMDDAVLGVAEAHAGEGGGVHHGVAGGGVLAVGAWRAR